MIRKYFCFPPFTSLSSLSGRTFFFLHFRSLSFSLSRTFCVHFISFRFTNESLYWNIYDYILYILCRCEISSFWKVEKLQVNNKIHSRNPFQLNSHCCSIYESFFSSLYSVLFCGFWCLIPSLHIFRRNVCFAWKWFWCLRTDASKELTQTLKCSEAA